MAKEQHYGLIRRPLVGLALGGGGARGLAHIGVLKVFERENVPIDYLAGTSMGGIVAAFYAAGRPAEALEAEVMNLMRPRNLLRLIDLSLLPHAGLFSGERVRQYLAEELGEDLTFDQLCIPLALTAVDLISGKEVVLREGVVIDAVRATSSFPAVFDPVEIGPYRLVDGGVLNNVPADVVRRLGAEVVVAVDVGLDFYDLALVDNPGTPPTTRIAHNAWRAESLMSEVLVRQRLAAAQPEIVLHPRIPGEISAFSGFNEAAKIVAAGEAAAVEALPRLKKLVRPRMRLPRLPGAS